MSAAIRLEIHVFGDDYNPKDIWHEHKTFYTRLHMAASTLTKALKTISGGDLTQSEFESVWTFEDQNLSALTEALERMGITDVVPDAPDVEYVGFTVTIFY